MTTLTLARRYPVPEVRLRFRATEMAVRRAADGEPLLATAAFSNIESHLVLLRWPDFELVARIPEPDGVTFGLKTCAHAGSVVAWGANRPMRLDREHLAWEPMTDEPIAGPYPEHREICVAMASLDDGALVRVDLDTREVETFPDLVPDESPTRIVPGPDGRMFCVGMTVHADCQSNIPTSDGAHLVVFDSVDRTVLRCEQPVAGAEVLSVLCLDPTGRLLFLDGPTLTRGRSIWAWDLDADRFARIGSAPDGLREIVPAPDGSGLWATALEGMGSVTLGEQCEIDSARGHALPGNDGDQRMCKHLQWHDGELWCVCFDEVLRFRR
jgi:hypothetical protein